MTDPQPADATAVFTRPQPPRQRLLPVVVVTVVVTLAVLAALVVPVVIRGLTPSVSSQERTVHLTDGIVEATLVLPGGWSWRTHFGDESRGVAGSPDRRMTVELSLTGESDPTAAVETLESAPLGPWSEEALSAGIVSIRHARVIEQEVLVGAITEGPVTLAFRSSPSPDYDAELADLLATVEVRP